MGEAAGAEAGTATGGAGTAAGVAATTGSAGRGDHRLAGRKYTTAAASSSSKPVPSMGRTADAAKPPPSRPGRSWKGSLSTLLTGSNTSSPVMGSSASTGRASILSVRHTVCASARTKVASGNSCQRSFSSASSLRGDTLMAAASAAMCRPCFSRAARNMAPALVGPGWESVIEAATFEQQGFGGLGEAFVQLAPQVLQALDVAHAALYARGEPQALG